MSNEIFTMSENQKKNMVYNVNTDLKKGFLDAVRNGQTRMALEYMAFIVENWSDEMEEKNASNQSGGTIEQKKRQPKAAEATASEED